VEVEISTSAEVSSGKRRSLKNGWTKIYIDMFDLFYIWK
jgi:hypothetical protein